MTAGVVLMTYGSAVTSADVPEYLRSVYRGKEPPGATARAVPVVCCRRPDKRAARAGAASRRSGSHPSFTAVPLAATKSISSPTSS